MNNCLWIVIYERGCSKYLDKDIKNNSAVQLFSSEKMLWAKGDESFKALQSKKVPTL